MPRLRRAAGEPVIVPAPNKPPVDSGSLSHRIVVGPAAVLPCLVRQRFQCVAAASRVLAHSSEFGSKQSNAPLTTSSLRILSAELLSTGGSFRRRLLRRQE